MKSFKSIRNRIDSIGSTKQITKSMRLVSFAKAQKNKELLDEISNYYHANIELMSMLSTHEGSKTNSFFSDNGGGNSAIVVISTDRGLCSGYNSNIARTAANLIKKTANPSIITVGSKIAASFRRDNIPIRSRISGFSEYPIYEEAKLIADLLMELYREKKIDEVLVVYTKFISMIEQKVISQKLLPYETGDEKKNNGQWGCESGYSALVKKIIPDYLASTIYRAVVEAALCEQSIRVSSMDAASKNADELIEKLTLKYNQARQSSITSEITEILNGSNAVD